MSRRGLRSHWKGGSRRAGRNWYETIPRRPFIVASVITPAMMSALAMRETEVLMRGASNWSIFDGNPASTCRGKKPHASSPACSKTSKNDEGRQFDGIFERNQCLQDAALLNGVVDQHLNISR